MSIFLGSLSQSPWRKDKARLFSYPLLFALFSVGTAVVAVVGGVGSEEGGYTGNGAMCRGSGRVGIFITHESMAIDSIAIAIVIFIAIFQLSISCIVSVSVNCVVLWLE